MAEQRVNQYLTTNMKNNIVQHLLKNSQGGVLRKGAVCEAAEAFAVNRKTISRLWKAATEMMENGEPAHMVGKVKGYKRGEKKKVDEVKVRSLSVLERSSYRVMAPKLGVSKTTICRWVKDKQLRPHTSAIKPHLTDLNKLARLKWCLSQLQPNIIARTVAFNEMRNVVHIDEKWFYLTKSADRYYLLPDEEEPQRSCRSKRFITKVMFLCAVGRPHFGPNGETLFDGKLGIFPFTEMVPAQRNSKNRPRGTLETKPIPAVTQAVTREWLINKIIPAIHSKWPTSASKEIYIQQDNAKPHISTTDPEFEEAANSNGFKIQLICQPPNSPDTNILDLGFFRAIQSLKDKKACSNVDELLQNVSMAYEELTPQTLNKVFLTLQSVLSEILEVQGGNNYKIPHMNKDRLERIGALPNVLEVEERVVRDVLEYLALPQNNDGSSYDIGDLATAFGY
ncbi:uncharacterized protein LOC121779336 [Salvia splendens]|uniref:uncharacterized protein LOC121779336 n=1 Tax=Salvia splendens TaxID=180675 RepID=UPI001C256EBA|nr:uncharacterized protein LOC121779336 [Salvia splendens]